MSERYDNTQGWNQCRECGTGAILDEEAHDTHHDRIDQLEATIAAVAVNHVGKGEADPEPPERGWDAVTPMGEPPVGSGWFHDGVLWQHTSSPLSLPWTGYKNGGWTWAKWSDLQPGRPAVPGGER